MCQLMVKDCIISIDDVFDINSEEEKKDIQRPYDVPLLVLASIHLDYRRCG